MRRLLLWLSFSFLGVGVAYVAFQVVRLGDDPITWCGTRSERPGADAITADWTWIPPGWDCVYYRLDDSEREHVIARRRAR